MEKVKNKKLNFKTILATFGLLAVAIPGVVTVVACKSNVITSNQKVGLEKVIKVKSVQGAESDTEQNILSKILAVNENVTEQDVQVERDSFKATDYFNSGSVVVMAKATKFEGSVRIEITKQINFNKETALKKIRDIEVNGWGDLNAWFNAWTDYFNFMRDELINKVFEFTRLELSSKDTMQAKIKNILHQILITDLERWTISAEEYDSDSFAISYSNFEVFESRNQIKIEGNLSLNLFEPKDRAVLELQSMLFEGQARYSLVD